MPYSDFLKQVQEKQKMGEETYAIRRQPGVPLTGATVWTFDRTGEMRNECAVTAGGLINGVQTDEDGKLYITVGRRRLCDASGGKVFLAGRFGIFGGASGKHPFTGTYIKAAGKDAKALTQNNPYAPIPIEQKPGRPPDLGAGIELVNADGSNYGDSCWFQGAEWFYAGASPIVPLGNCCCPTMRAGLDWYKRSWVPEQYRHSIGVVDTSGNLILHVGRYGNLDSGDGPKSQIPVGGDNIAMSCVRFVQLTDNYAVFDDNGERVAVLKLNYHAEETTGLGGK